MLLEEDSLLATLEPDRNLLTSELLNAQTTKTESCRENNSNNHELVIHVPFSTEFLFVLFMYFAHIMLLLFFSQDALLLAITSFFIFILH